MNLAERYKASDEFKATDAKCARLMTDLEAARQNNARVKSHSSVKYVNGFFWQVCVCVCVCVCVTDCLVFPCVVAHSHGALNG